MVAAPASHDPYAPLRVANFRRFAWSILTMAMGAQIQGVVVAWQMYALTRDPLALGMVGLAEAAPFIGFALYAGHVADVRDRRRVALTALAVLTVAAAALAAASFWLVGGGSEAQLRAAPQTTMTPYMMKRTPAVGAAPPARAGFSMNVKLATDSAAAQTNSTTSAVSATRRRSSTSATWPAKSANPMNGAASASPTMPSASGSCVSAYICQATTTPWICAPIAIAQMLATNHRNAGIRSGA